MNCPICSSENLKEKEKFNKYILYECRNCLVQFWWPLMHPGQKFYETSELHRIEGKKKLQWRHKQFFKDIPIKSGHLLDIACGTGEFLDAAHNIGFNVWGIDISSKQIAAAKKFYRLENIYTDALENFSQRKNLPKFNIITFFEILEHLDNPKEFLNNIKKLLAENGFIVLSVPNTKRVGIGKESEEKPPNHLLRWTRESITNFLKQENFEIIKIVEQPFSKDFFFTTNFFSFGLIKKIKNKAAINTSENTQNIALNTISKVANIKNVFLLPIAFFLAIFPRILGYKYWDLYIVAKLKNEN